MRFTAAAVSIFLAASPTSSFTVVPNTHAFAPRKSIINHPAGRHGVIANLVETSGGMEELHEIAEPSDRSSVENLIQRSPSFWKLAGYASIPLSAALGFGLVPSRRIAAHAVGAAVTGLAGAVGKSRLDAALTDNFSRPAIAAALVDESNGGFMEDATGTAQKVKQVQTEYGIPDEDFSGMCTEMYTKYLLGMVKFQVQPRTSELKELEGIKTALNLDNLQVGEAHATAASDWYRQTCLFTPEEDLDDPDHPDRKAMDKLLFLTERALRQGGETEEAFVFEMTRTAKALNLTYQTALDRVAEVVEPFYQRALKSTRSKLGTSQVSSGMLERARRTLGVSDETAFDMHVSCFNEEVKSLLGKTAADGEEESDGESSDGSSDETMKFPEGAMERLNQLKDILALSDRDIEYEISVEATPLYQATALSAMKDVLAGGKSADEAWEVMDDRREELLLPEESSKTLVSSMVMQALGVPLEQSNKFAKVNNEAATYDHLLEALEAKEALISILTKSGWEEFDKFDEIFCNPWDRQSANGFLLAEDRIKLYRIFLTRSVRKAGGGKLSDETFADVMQVKGLLGISDEQQEVEARAAFGPELRKVLQNAMEEIVSDYTPDLVVNMQAEVDAVMERNRLKEDFLRELGATFYAKAVALVSGKAPAGIPTQDLSDALSALQTMYKLEKEDTYPSHVEYFGSVYRKSVLEAMGTTGVIRPEFRGPLDDLRDRLGVSDDACKKIFLEAVQEKMVPMVEWIGSEMERTMLTQQQISKRRGKDIGEDVFQSGKGADGVLGLGAEVNIMSDIMNLVDFYTENDIAEQKEIGTKSVEKPSSEGEEASMEEVPVYETSFPVTALGADAIDQEMAELLYRQFVVGGFQTQGPQGARYEGARATFGGILGLTSEKMEEINDNIGNTVYDNFVGHSMKSKGTLDQQDMMFLANIQGKLGLSSEQGEKMLIQSQKKVLSEEIEVLMDDPTPVGIKAFREKCNVMGMDLIEDVGISIPRLTRMFESEVIPGLKSGEISPENMDILGDIQESLGIEPDECETLFENVLVRLANNALTTASGEILRGREENAVDLIEEIVRYAGFTEGDLGLSVEEATAYKILNMYEAFDFEGVDEETIEDNTELLKIAVGLS